MRALRSPEAEGEDHPVKAQFVVSSVGEPSAPHWVALVATRDGNDEWAFDDGSGMLRGDLNLWLGADKHDPELFTVNQVVTVDIQPVVAEEVTPSPSTPSDAPAVDEAPTPSAESPDPAPAAEAPSVETSDPSSSDAAGPSTTTTDSAESSPPAESSSTA